MNWQPILDFIYNNWFRLAVVLWLFYFAKRCGSGWIKEQLEWVKLMFVDDDDLDVKNAPSHKNAILMALTVVFIMAFLRKMVLSESVEVPDIPGGWQLVLLAGLGIAAAKTGAQKLFENKWSNGNGNGSGDKPKP